MLKLVYFQIAAEVSAPLAKTDEIVLIGGQDRTTAEISKLCGTLPPAVQALTGVDITGVGITGVHDHNIPDVHHAVGHDIIEEPVVFQPNHIPKQEEKIKPLIKLGSFHMH